MLLESREEFVCWKVVSLGQASTHGMMLTLTNEGTLAFDTGIDT